MESLNVTILLAFKNELYMNFLYFIFIFFIFVGVSFAVKLTAYVFFDI